MRKGMWSAAAVTVLVSAAMVGGGPQAGAADTAVKMVEGSSSDPNTWRFTPEEITVPVGSTVTWTNAGKLEHDARTDSQEFSPLLSGGESHTFTFNTPGKYEYYCEPHRALGMTGVITVTGAAATPTTAPAAAPGTAPPAGGGGTTTTAKGAPQSTTTTTRPGAGDSGGSTSTTTAGSGVTSTTQASATTPTSAPDSGGVTTTTAAPGGDAHPDEEALETDSGAGGSESNPVGIALVGISTALLAAISLKLLTAKP